MLAEEMMTPKIEYVTDKNTHQEAAEKMQSLDVGELPIIIGDTAVGIVTDRDITFRGVANGLNPKMARVVDAMTEGVLTCNEGDPIEKAAQVMGTHKVRRLPVLDAGGKMSGTVSLGDLALDLDSKQLGDVLAEISK